MRRFIGILGSLAIGLLLTGAGLILDANTLIYSGVVVFAVMAALWLWTWARPIRVQVPVHVPAPPSEPEPTESKARAVWALKRARDNAAISVHQGSPQSNERAYNEIAAALLTIKREFGFGTLKLVGKGFVPYDSLLKVQITYMDRIIPLLREGHVEEARQVAMAFGWQWQDHETGMDGKLMAER